jgi:hypothetical protein
MQLYITVLSGMLSTTGLYYGMEYIEKHHTTTYEKIQQLVAKYSLRRSGFLLKLQQILDGGE